jgi:hypothetical protein
LCDLIDPSQALGNPVERSVESESVPTFRVDVHLKGNAVFSQRRSKQETVLKGNAGILSGMPEKTRRCADGYMLLAREFIEE